MDSFHIWPQFGLQELIFMDVVWNFKSTLGSFGKFFIVHRNLTILTEFSGCTLLHRNRRNATLHYGRFCES